jgi:hypothetical protein
MARDSGSNMARSRSIRAADSALRGRILFVFVRGAPGSQSVPCHGQLASLKNLQTLTATLNAVTSAGLSDDGSDAPLGLASSVAISVLSVAEQA